MKIDIKTIPHREQRYNTVGDYFSDKKGLHFRISDLGCWEFEAAVLLHELTEYFWVKMKGIKISDIDAFDMYFEKEREMGIHSEDAEPGDDPKSPYHIGHCLATAVERLWIGVSGKSWEMYAQACENASGTWNK